MKKIKRNFEVIVISGDHRGKRGKVLQVLKKGRFLLVEGINLVKKHVKANPNANREGGILSKTLPIDSSKVQVYDPNAHKASKIGIHVTEGKRERYFKASQNVIAESKIVDQV